LIDDWPEPHPAAGVVARVGGTTELVATRGDLDAVAEWASVTKPLVALAVLVACDRGVVELGDPAGPPGATVRHLLSHASGLGPDRPEPLTAPGIRRIYSNAGFEVLATYLEQHVGGSWDGFVNQTVTGPLGMLSTRVPPGGSAASGARGSLRDLLALAGELLSPSIVTRGLFDVATAVAFPGLPGVVPGIGRYSECDWGLGFELKSSKRTHWTATSGSPRTFGHFGRSGAFFWVDPDAGVACASAGGAEFGRWALDQWPRFSDAVLGRPAEAGPRFGAADR
jgi:CubicO group peptidase (beta-lactamase class C family)